MGLLLCRVNQQVYFISNLQRIINFPFHFTAQPLHLAVNSKKKAMYKLYVARVLCWTPAAVLCSHAPFNTSKYLLFLLAPLLLLIGGLKQTHCSSLAKHKFTLKLLYHLAPLVQQLKNSIYLCTILAVSSKFIAVFPYSSVIEKQL